MDFFGSQDRARSRTKTLVALYIAAICAIILLIYLVAVVAGFGASLQEDVSSNARYAQTESKSPDFYDPALFGIVAGLVVLIVGGASLFKIKSMGTSGAKVARSVGGRPVDSSTRDPDERKLLNIVEEMSIASGVPMPDVFILENEFSINAFAAGYDVDDAAIAVTKGTIQQLSRDELQGVIAHEFSHILSGDMRLNIRLIGPLFGLLVIAFLGRMFLYSGGRRSSSNNNGGIVVLGLAIMVIGYVGVLFGRLIQAAISRQREYLADASAVQFTRNPEGIGNALRRLGNRTLGSKINHEHAEDTAHLFFASALGSSLATHPPLPKRIRAVLPDWDGSFLPPRKESTPPEEKEAVHKGQGAAARGAGGITNAATAVAAIGVLSQEGIKQGIESKIRIRRALGDFPFSDPEAAKLLFLALILDENADKRDKQLGSLQDPKEVSSLYEKLLPLSIPDKYAVMELGCSGLRKIPESAQKDLIDTLESLADSDQRLSLREALILHVARSQIKLGSSGKPHPSKKGGAKTIEKIAPQVSDLLFLTASVSSPDSESAKALFEKATGGQYLLSGKLRVPEQRMPLERLEEVLQTVSTANYGLRRQVIAAAADIILEDEHASEAEWTLLRLISISIGAPMPPIVPS